jgi:hypothetical protein
MTKTRTPATIATILWLLCAAGPAAACPYCVVDNGVLRPLLLLALVPAAVLAAAAVVALRQRRRSR